MIVGIDGCPAGWCAIVHKNGEYHGEVFPIIDELVRFFPQAKAYLIDIPIGLENQTIKRNVDSQVRKLLKPYRSSSVFTPPCREALKEHSYEKASKANHIITGKKLTLQAWNIMPKIKEVDNFLTLNKSYGELFYEAHPEMCFAGLNSGQPMGIKKTAAKQEGYHERMRVLLRLDPGFQKTVKDLLAKYQRKQVRRDDILDAACLCLTGKLGLEQGFSMISNEPAYDDADLPIRLVYYHKRK